MPVTIPTALQKQFPELTELIAGSESMNDEERQYWLNILPIMTPEQLENLSQILQNERARLAEIDAKYDQEIKRLGSTESIQKTAAKRHSQRQARQEQEQKAEGTESEAIEDVLMQIENL